eukprot:6173596-Pleurochrysis_carterae.AAC.2
MRRLWRPARSVSAEVRGTTSRTVTSGSTSMIRLLVMAAAVVVSSSLAVHILILGAGERLLSSRSRWSPCDLEESGHVGRRGGLQWARLSKTKFLCWLGLDCQRRWTRAGHRRLAGTTVEKPASKCSTSKSPHWAGAPRELELAWTCTPRKAS